MHQMSVNIHQGVMKITNIFRRRRRNSIVHVIYRFYSDVFFRICKFHIFSSNPKDCRTLCKRKLLFLSSATLNQLLLRFSVTRAITLVRNESIAKTFTSLVRIVRQIGQFGLIDFHDLIHELQKI